MQELIAVANMYGIGKRELLECYYIDEISEVLRICAELRFGGRENTGEETMYVGAGEFFGM